MQGDMAEKVNNWGERCLGPHTFTPTYANDFSGKGEIPLCVKNNIYVLWKVVLDMHMAALLGLGTNLKDKQRERERGEKEREKTLHYHSEEVMAVVSSPYADLWLWPQVYTDLSTTATPSPLGSSRQVCTRLTLSATITSQNLDHQDSPSRSGFTKEIPFQW